MFSEAMAMTGMMGGDSGGSQGGIEQFLLSISPIVLIGAVFYFLLIRPQQKKLKQHQDILASIRKGDRIVMNGGLVGVVFKIVNDKELQLEISDNVRVSVMRHLVNDVLTMTERTFEEGKSKGSSGGKEDKKHGKGSGRNRCP